MGVWLFCELHVMPDHITITVWSTQLKLCRLVVTHRVTLLLCCWFEQLIITLVKFKAKFNEIYILLKDDTSLLSDDSEDQQLTSTCASAIFFSQDYSFLFFFHIFAHLYWFGGWGFVIGVLD